MAEDLHMFVSYPDAKASTLASYQHIIDIPKSDSFVVSINVHFIDIIQDILRTFAKIEYVYRLCISYMCFVFDGIVYNMAS
jgi:hypothetical protein